MGAVSWAASVDGRYFLATLPFVDERYIRQPYFFGGAVPVSSATGHWELTLSATRGNIPRLPRYPWTLLIG